MRLLCSKIAPPNFLRRHEDETLGNTKGLIYKGPSWKLVGLIGPCLYGLTKGEAQKASGIGARDLFELASFGLICVHITHISYQ